MVHIPIALLLLLALWFVPTPWGLALAIVCVFFMREVTQAEYRWIEANGGLRAAMPWWKGMDMTLWNDHSITDVLLPAAAVFVVTYAATHFLG